MIHDLCLRVFCIEVRRTYKGERHMFGISWIFGGVSIALSLWASLSIDRWDAIWGHQCDIQATPEPEKPEENRRWAFYPCRFVNYDCHEQICEVAGCGFARNSVILCLLVVAGRWCIYIYIIQMKYVMSLQDGRVWYGTFAPFAHIVPTRSLHMDANDSGK